MAYKTKFLHFKTKASYEAERAKTTEGSEERKVFDAYISFIDEGPTICTWGKEYQCDANSLSLLPQEVAAEKQDQVFKNLGWNVHVISQSDINAGSPPSDEEKAKRLEATALLVKETSNIYLRGNDDSNNHYFFKVNTSSQLELLRLSIITGVIYRISSQFIDTGSIRYDKTQSLTEDQKARARKNIDAASKEEVLPLTIDVSSTSVEDYNIALEAFNSKKPLTIFDSSDPTFRFTSTTIEKETNTNDINVYFSFTGINDNTFNAIGYVETIKPTGEKTSSFAAIQPSNMDPKPLGQASPGIGNSYSRSDHVHPAQVDITGNAATATTATNLASAPSFINNGNIIKITVGNKTSTEFTVPYASKTSAAEKLMYGRNILLDGDVTGSTTESFNGSKNVTINTTISTINAEKLTGTINADRLPEIPISKIPAAAMERLYVVESQSAAMSLTIQEGDVVQIGSGGPMYFCVSESASTFATKFKEFTVGSATSVPWSGVTGKPTFATVATSGSYNDLTNKPTIPSLSGYATQNWVTSQGYLTSIPTATASVLGGVKIGSNISVSSGTISLTSANVTSALGFTPAKLLSPDMLSSNTVSAGYSYINAVSRTISSLSGFSLSNPDSVIISTAKLTFTASNAIKMDGLGDLTGGTYYIYCLSYMANGKIAVNGAVYA